MSKAIWQETAVKPNKTLKPIQIILLANNCEKKSIQNEVWDNIYRRRTVRLNSCDNKNAIQVVGGGDAESSFSDQMYAARGDQNIPR